MGDISYAPLIEDMIWSYSRVNSFDQCGYRWFLNYIDKSPQEDTFFASYGTFIHKLLQQYYSGEKSKKTLKQDYLTWFYDEVRGIPPSEKVFDNYFMDGLRCIEALEPLPFEVVATEKPVRFEIAGRKVRGYIDVLCKDGNSYIIVDHKSRKLEPRGKRRKKSDEELDAYLKQLYLYSEAIYQEYNTYPKELCFNCFRTGKLIREPFNYEALDNAIEWFITTVPAIAQEEDFRPSPEFFKCKYLCEQYSNCEYRDMV